jgi:hypothetical protein
MLEPEYLAGVADDFVELYAQVERDITADVARRIAKTGYLTETAKWQLERAKQIGMLQKDVEKILSEATGLSKPAIRKLMSEAAQKALKADDAIYAAAGLPKLDLFNSATLKAILLQGTKNTQQVMKNFTNITAKTARKALEESLDRAYLQVMSGAFTREQAIKNSVNDLAKQGITKIAYQNPGKRPVSISVEAGIRRAVTTGINQTVAGLQIARAEELGSDLVETSSHSGARPTHAVWQGQVFSLSGNHGRYRDFYDATGYGSGDGLCGWNCYHNFFPYIEGVSSPSFERDPSARLGKTNDEAYDESQKQRYYERQVREAKKRVAVYDAANSAATTADEQIYFAEKLQESKQLVRKRQKALRDYCEATGRDQEYSRTYVVGYNKPYSIGSD